VNGAEIPIVALLGTPRRNAAMSWPMGAEFELTVGPAVKALLKLINGGVLLYVFM
jgi:hypothetical protein